MGKIDYMEQVRKSIRKDLAKANFKKIGRTPKPPRPKNVKRIKEINESCNYRPYSRHMVGRLIKIVGEPKPGFYWVEFVHDGDRENLNAIAGYADKKQYLLYKPKFD